jgi:transposase-like protein
MILVLEGPFKEVWTKGYLRESKDGRKRVDLVSWPHSRTTISYARYLLSVQLGRFLTDEEQADHIDQDKTNDSLENLQVLTIDEHKLKTKEEVSGLTLVSCICDFCNLTFSRRKAFTGRTENTFCSRSCNAKYNRAQGKWVGNAKQTTDEILEKIIKLRADGLSDYKISDIIGISRSIIYRERKLNKIP